MKAIGEFELKSVTWGEGDIEELAKLIEQVIKEKGEIKDAISKG